LPNENPPSAKIFDPKNMYRNEESRLEKQRERMSFAEEVGVFPTLLTRMMPFNTRPGIEMITIMIKRLYDNESGIGYKPLISAIIMINLGRQ